MTWGARAMEKLIGHTVGQKLIGHTVGQLSWLSWQSCSLGTWGKAGCPGTTELVRVCRVCCWSVLMLSKLTLTSIKDYEVHTQQEKGTTLRAREQACPRSIAGGLRLMQQEPRWPELRHGPTHQLSGFNFRRPRAQCMSVSPARTAATLTWQGQLSVLGPVHSHPVLADP